MTLSLFTRTAGFTGPHDVSGTNRVSADIKTVRDP